MLDALPDIQAGNQTERVKAALKRLHEASGEIVGQVFYGTLLKQMRESSLKGEYGHGGRGEEAFAGQYHAILADRMGKAPNNRLADAIYEAYERQQRNIAESKH